MNAPDAAIHAAQPSGRRMVSVTDLTKSFALDARHGGPQSLLALDRVSLAVHAGEIVSLLGASGCGKTTLLRIVAGLLPYDTGSVVVGDAPVQGPRRDVAMVFQNFGLLPWRSVMANVEFALEVDGMPARERRDTCRHYIELVGLKGFEAHFPHELSGGMQQRVGIARAMTRKPAVLLMDEPFAALDAQTRENLQDDVLRIAGEHAMTVLFVTHSIDEALVMSDRIVMLRSRPGRVRTIIPTPFGRERNGDAVRSHGEFGHWRHTIRQMLKEEQKDV